MVMASAPRRAPSRPLPCTSPCPYPLLHVRTVEWAGAEKLLQMVTEKKNGVLTPTFSISEDEDAEDWEFVDPATNETHHVPLSFYGHTLSKFMFNDLWKVAKFLNAETKAKSMEMIVAGTDVPDRKKTGARLAAPMEAKEAEASRQAAITAADKGMQIQIAGDVLSIGPPGGTLVVS